MLNAHVPEPTPDQLVCLTLVQISLHLVDQAQARVKCWLYVARFTHAGHSAVMHDNKCTCNRGWQMAAAAHGPSVCHQR